MTVVLAILAATAFAISVQTAWWTAGEANIGPFGVRSCFTGECRESRLGLFGGGDLWLRSAVATTAAAYIAMFVLLMFAGAIAAKREPRLIARVALASIATAAVSGLYFALAAPQFPAGNLSYGMFMFIGGIALGVVAAILFLRSPRRSS